MDIEFEDDTLGKLCNDDRQLINRLNRQRAKLIRRRPDDLAAAPTLSVMRTLPGRCHELKGNRANQISLDLDGPNRLIFRPAHSPLPLKPDGGLDWNLVTAVAIVEVTDTHD